MLQITIPAGELWDERRQEFVYVKRQTLQLEHSLVSIAKWESKWNKPFLGKQTKTDEELLDYIRCMTITQNVDPDVYRNLTRQNVEDIRAYMEAPMTATWFSEDKNKPGRSSKVITAEVIYYWMIALNIPFECQRWHLNRLLTLVKVCNAYNKPPKKMGKHALMQRNSALNAARRSQLNTRG